ncbi:beta-N-acetylhexosaminidase [Acidobacterium sp. S8]|uniref:beta-N-acetylhexosaminidase n=1 Tax=Acidobacterium sp. S8 TaxID=1641854 RepID=UPI00131A931B|nr:beta-N-acetylhexosaminidase [Acidobacterium sp. S8]
MSITLRRQVGQLIIAGLEGPRLTAMERTWLKLIRPSGVILFRRNVEEANQTAQLLRDVTEITVEPMFRCVDLEGGLVDRLRDVIAPMPPPAAVFATGKPSLFKKQGSLIGQEARMLGFNTVFAPVLDLALPASSDVMRTRAVSPDPTEVAAYGSAFLEGLAAQNIVGCGKHFPGLGGGNLDSHHAMPVINRSFEVMWREDLVPFRLLAAQLPMVMVSHASYPQAAKEKTPASISSFWMKKILREKLRFRGLIISDDMEMGGILTQCSIEEAAIESVASGMDLIEICKDPELVLRAYEALLSEAESSISFRRIVHGAEVRIRRFKTRPPILRIPTLPRKTAIHKLALEVNRFAEK